MKTYEELTDDQQAKAREGALATLLQEVLDDGFRFNDERNGDNFQATIDAARAKANDMQTPWFAGEYIMDARYDPGQGHIKEDDGLWPVKETLEGMALCQAEDALYSEPTEHVIAGIADSLSAAAPARKEG